MRQLLLLFSFLLVAACASSLPSKAPSMSGVGSAVTAIGQSITAAQANQKDLKGLADEAWKKGIPEKSTQAAALQAKVKELESNLSAAEMSKASAMSQKDWFEGEYWKYQKKAEDTFSDNDRLRRDLGRSNKRTLVCCAITYGVFLLGYFMAKLGRVAAMVQGIPVPSFVPAELAVGTVFVLIWLALLALGLLFWTSLGSVVSRVTLQDYVAPKTRLEETV